MLNIIELNAAKKFVFEESTQKTITNLYKAIQDKNINPYTLDNIIDEPKLNEQGLQVYRCLLYEQLFETKRKQTRLYGSQVHYHLEKNGYIQINNLFPQQQFEALRNAIKTNIPQEIMLRHQSEDLGFELRIPPNTELQNIFKLCQADNKYQKNHLYLRKISHIEPGEYCEDARQYNFHIDKFYPNFKVWYFPYEITESHGPLAIFEGTNRCSVEKMRWTHERVLNKLDWSRLHYDVTDYPEKIKNTGIKTKEIRFTVAENTLVITDNRSFHRRSPAEPGKLRYAFRAILERNNII